MDYSHFVKLLSTDIAGNFTALDMFLDLLLLNVRAFILLLCCFLILRIVKGSAQTRHFLTTVALLSVLLLPLSSRLIPAFEIPIEAASSPAVETADSDGFLVVGAQAQKADLFTVERFYRICLGVYFLGLAFILAKVLTSNLKLVLLVRMCTPVTASNWLKILEKHRSRMGIRRKIDLRYSDLNTSPSTWGAFRPVILLPARALQWPDHLIQSTVLHELAHIKRYDWLVQQITRCVCAVYWINPLCWVAARQLFANAETACDDMAINAGVRNVHYARNLVDVAEQVLQHQSFRPAALTMAPRGKHSQLADRILAILNGQACRAPLTKSQTALILFAFVCLLVPMASVRAHFVEVPAEEAADVVEPLNQTREESATTDHIAAIPVRLETENRTAEQPETVPIDRLAQLKEVLNNTRTPPARHTGLAPPHGTGEIEYELDFSLRDSDIPRRSVSNQKAEKSGLESAVGLLKKHLRQKLAADPIPVNDIALKNNVSGPFRRNLIVPNYPHRAQYRGIEGKVTVEYAIDRHGTVVDAHVVSADPDNVFDREVLKAIKKSTFHPRTIDGSPVPAEGLKETYIFVLES